MLLLENKVRYSIHGFIYFSEQERQLIDSPEYQRLRYLKQLALTSYVYPGAVHTRFEHSLGVMEMATRMFNKLENRLSIKEEIIQNFKKIGLEIIQAKQILRLAALLHDIGHLPFSHGGEAVLPKGKRHEDISIFIIDSLRSKIDSVFFNGVTDLVIQLIKKDVVLPELYLLKYLVSGSIDADRMDYLLRDSHHCGVDYGYFDHKRLIESLTVVERNGGGLDLAIEYGGIHALEALILARYYMFTQVYYHRTRRIYDIYLQNYLKSWVNKFKDFSNITKDNLDDLVLIQDMKKAAINEKHKYHQYAYRICNRKHHSMVFQTSDFTNADVRIKAEGIFENLSNKYLKYDFIIDNPSKGTKIHEFFVEDRDDGDEVGQKLYVMRNKRSFLLTKESHIIREMPKRFHAVRIYVDSKDLINKIDKEALCGMRHEAIKLEEKVKE